MKNLFVSLLLFLVCTSSITAQKNSEEKMDMTLYAIENMYVDSVSAAPIIDSQIAQMLKKLDPFSEYLPPMQANGTEQLLRGYVPSVGIGIEGCDIKSHFYVSFVEPESDAYIKGLRAGDEITSINGEAVSDITPEKIFPKLSGNAKSTVLLSIKHVNGRISQCEVVRNYIQSSSVQSAYMLNKQTGYISISMFSENTLSDFRKAMTYLLRHGMKTLVLDISKNSGGFFEQAVALADEFIDGNKPIVYTQGAHVPREVFNAKSKGMFEKGKVVLLVSEQTKSAAEIFAGAMQDCDRAVLVGRCTFGKGLIQQTMPFKDGSALKLTVARYYTPSGRTIQKPYNGHSYIDTTKKYYSMCTHRLLRNIGGISPDFTVSPDTATFTQWYNFITYSGVQKAVSRNYVVEHRKELHDKYKTFDSFAKSFDGSVLLHDVCDKANNAGITFDTAGYDRSKNYLQIQLKALVARDLFNDNTCYYRIINTRNSSINEAINVLAKKDLYNRTLNTDK